MKTTTIIPDAKLRRLPDGTIEALSSDGHTRYVVTIGDHVSCTCPGFTNHGRCYHSTSALRRMPAFYSRPVVKPRAEASLLYA